ncbi:MAG: carboxypeptidase regulatory-like domain-containing protein [Cyclobacteriaceae bacterium]|nr:carboxypeptidase regulatory-like domain-containing protein [Cyclobacteriaceae bacterium]MDH4294909.1 carboxypeptidase regulatory-like domain-containing protein [Cyclobacteriaceae bacterium]MDH5249374.1 carboxypeptidase regulatory-like domain-containing protein [Cyclobacteriaceae bacterium]
MNMTTQYGKNILLLLSFVLAVTAGVQAQGVTSATITGQVTDKNGEGLAGASVIAVHVPSGTTYGSASRADGRFTLPGMRIGGPYKLSVSYVGYKEYVQEGIMLALGQNFVLDAALVETGLELQEVVISSNSLLNDERTGASTNIGVKSLNSLPTINRSISDFTRMTPQANGRSFSGADSRFNNLTIDGSIFNNSFGLSDVPGGQTNSTPISLDAIQELQVNIAPFDVRQGGFTGAGVNAVTRSGTNEISGSVFFNSRNEKFVGDKAKGEDVVTQNFNVGQRGFSVGGPVIKDKLFFFINGEQERRDDPATQYVALRPGVNDNDANVSRVLASDLDQLKAYLINTFDYNPGAYENYSLNTRSDKALIRLDYNMNQRNKFSIRYNYLKSSRDVPTSNSGSFSNRRDNGFAMNFQNANYVINNDINSIIAEHNYLGDNFSNNVIAGFTANRDYRSSLGGIFPLVDILEGGRNYTNFGFEPFTPNNILNTDTWQFQDNFTYYSGKHTLTAGVNFESFKFENTFTPTYYGQFVYNSLQDFYDDTDNTPANDPELRRYQLTYSNLTNSALPTATTKARQIGFYVQDEIQVNANIKLTAGLRVDVPSFKQTALENSEVLGYTFKDENGNLIKVATSQLPKTQALWSPRIGFNWDVMGDRSLQVRGGSGIFSGRPAFVWISNQMGNNGILTGSLRDDNTTGQYPFSPDVTKYNLPPNPGQPAASYNIAVTDPKFKYPQTWKTNLAIDKQLPFGIIGTVEFIFNKQVNNVKYVNVNLEPANADLSGSDARNTYPGLGLTDTTQNNANRVNDNITDAILLTNTNKGKGYSATIKFERPATNGLSAMIAYNFSKTKDLMSAGSIAFSSWRDNLTVNGNNLPTVAYSNNDLRHRIIAATSYRKEYGGHFASQLTLFYQAQNQGRFSYAVNGDLNGDQLTSNDLLYVPKNTAELNFEEYTITVSGNPVTFTAGQQAAAFNAFIDQDDYLSTRRGQYVERNGALIPFVSTLDLSFVQEFFLDVKGKRNTLQFRVDIFNFGNLLNNKWGVGKTIINSSPLQVISINANGEPVYRFNTVNNVLQTDTYRTRVSIDDVWQMQLGLRYIFN